MIETINEILTVPINGKNVNFQVPILQYESIEEGDTAAGKVGAMLAQANLNMKYRGPYADARVLIADVVTEVTGEEIAMRPTGEKDEDGNEVMEQAETEKKFVRRVIGENQALFDQVQSIVSERARGYTTKNDKGESISVPALAVDITEKEHKPRKPAKLAKKYLEQAKNFLSGAINPRSGKPFNLDKFLSVVHKELEKVWERTGDDAKDAENLGWVCKAYADHLAETSATKF